MAVYMIAQLTIHNREEYDIYSSQFMDVFTKFNGTMLSADFEPEVLKGDWTADRSILIEFPDKSSAMAWWSSDAYQKIAKHRDAGGTLDAILVRGLG